MNLYERRHILKLWWQSFSNRKNSKVKSILKTSDPASSSTEPAAKRPTDWWTRAALYLGLDMEQATPAEGECVYELGTCIRKVSFIEYQEPIQWDALNLETNVKRIFGPHSIPSRGRTRARRGGDRDLTPRPDSLQALNLQLPTENSFKALHGDRRSGTSTSTAKYAR